MAVPLDARAMREDMLERAGFDLAYREDVLAEIGDDSPGAFSLGSSMQWLHALEQKE